MVASLQWCLVLLLHHHHKVCASSKHYCIFFLNLAANSSLSLAVSLPISILLSLLTGFLLGLLVCGVGKSALLQGRLNPRLHPLHLQCTRKCLIMKSTSMGSEWSYKPTQHTSSMGSAASYKPTQSTNMCTEYIIK